MKRKKTNRKNINGPAFELAMQIAKHQTEGEPIKTPDEVLEKQKKWLQDTVIRFVGNNIVEASIRDDTVTIKFPDFTQARIFLKKLI